MESLIRAVVLSDMTKEDAFLLENIRSGSIKTQTEEEFLKSLYDKYNNRLKIQSVKRVLERRLDSYYMNKIINCEDCDELLPILKEIRDAEDKEDNVRNSRYLFMTFAPASTYSCWDIMKKINDIVKWKWVKKYLYVVEQRFDGIPNEKYKEVGQGHHIHMIVDKGDYKPSHIKREIKKRFEAIVCNIDYKFIKDCDLLKTQNYMLGDKKDDYKKLRQVQDKIFREKEGLAEYYGETWD